MAQLKETPRLRCILLEKLKKHSPASFSFLANPKYEEYLYRTQASLVIINAAQELKEPVQATLIRVPDAYSAFATLLTKYQEMATQKLSGIQEPAYISKSAKMGQQVYIGAFSYLGENVVLGNNVKIFPNVFLGDNVKINDNTIVHPGVKIYHDCVIGKNVTIHAGTVIGSDGFGFAPQADGSFKKVPQIGNVVVEDFVEIGANATIDRATIGSTVIKSGAKLDNLIQVAHNVEVGNNTVIAAQAGVSGSTKDREQCYDRRTGRYRRSYSNCRWQQDQCTKRRKQIDKNTKCSCYRQPCI